MRGGIRGLTLRNQQKTHCAAGHEYSPENTRISKEGWRRCRTCERGRRRLQLGWDTVDTKYSDDTWQ